ncbi:MAG: hypothetical protein PUF31_01790, partial [Oscillospiraceae bacterium]|nr:hypothetical protein [Oscillospiraceae bacterium]
SGTQLSIKNRDTRHWRRHATDKLKFIAQPMARALSFQLRTVTPGIGVATRPTSSNLSLNLRFRQLKKYSCQKGTLTHERTNKN